MGGFGAFIDKLCQNDAYKRGKQFERVCKWFLENDPSYRRQIKKVWLWDDWPGRWGPDAGIDLVAEARSGDVWAIQAKAYDPKYSVTKSDIDRFMSESARKQINYRLLIATTDFLSPNARRTIEAQEKPVGILNRTELENASVNWATGTCTFSIAQLGCDILLYRVLHAIGYAKY